MKAADLKQEIIDDWSALGNWRREAREDYAFFSGDQWSDQDRKTLRDAGRLVVEFNRIAPIVDSVVGSEINNRSEVRFIPRDLGDAAVNELLTGAAEWFRDEADAEEEETDAFQDCCIAGLGVVYTHLETMDDPSGEAAMERIDPMEMGWDRRAHRRNLRDAKRVFWARSMSIADAKDLFPGKSREALHAAWLPRSDSTNRDSDEPGDQYDSANEASPPPDKDEVVIVHVQWKERQTYHMARDPYTGQVAELTHEQAKFARASMPGLQTVPAKRWVFKQAFIGRDVLEEGDAPNQADFDFQFITGKRDRNKRLWYGIVRPAKSPQQMANRWLTQSVHIMNSNAKGGVMVEAGAVKNLGEFEENWAKADAVQYLEDGALSKGAVQPKPMAQFPAGYQALTEFAVSSIRDATGVNLEMLGLRDANQAGVLEYQRRQSAMTILAKFFDALRAYRKRQGRVLLEYITKYLSDGRLVKIAGDDGAQYVPLVRQPDTIRYDVIVDESASSPNQKEETWAFITQMLPLMGESLGPEGMALILKYSPLPESLVSKLLDMQKQPDPQAEAMNKLQMDTVVAELEKTKSETAENISQAHENYAQAMMAPGASQGLAVQPLV